MTSQFFSWCPSCREYARQWCSLTKLCQVEVCTNCDHNTHEADGCRVECPECGDAVESDAHEPVVFEGVLMLRCFNSEPATLV